MNGSYPDYTTVPRKEFLNRADRRRFAGPVVFEPVAWTGMKPKKKRKKKRRK
jgi:hypothetical protein